MTLLEYLKNTLFKIYDHVKDDDKLADEYDEEIQFLKDQINKMEDINMKIKKVTVGKGYAMNLGNFNRCRVDLQYEVELDKEDDVDSVQSLMFAKLDDDLRDELKKNRIKKEGK